MATMASQINSLTVVCSIVYSGVNQRKHQSSASLTFVRGIHRYRWIPRTKGQLRGKCFHVMTSSWDNSLHYNTWRPWQDGRHFPDIFKCIFLNESAWISIKISLKFVQSTILRHWFRQWLDAGQARCCCRNQWCLFYWRTNASLGLSCLFPFYCTSMLSNPFRQTRQIICMNFTWDFIAIPAH